MTINYTTLLGLAKPVTGTESGTWGDVVNDQITSLVEDAIANAASLNVTSGNVTLTDNNGSSDQARMAILLVTGTPGTSRNIIAPSTSKWYIVKNGSNAEVVLKGSATTGVTIPAGVEALAFWNGSDFELVSMVGPSSSTDNAITRYDGTTGKVVQNSGVTIDDSNNMTGVVALTTTGVVTVPAGTNSAPAITTTGDTNTGIYFPAADQVAVTTGGTARLFVDSDGDVGIGTSSPASKLDVYDTGNTTFTLSGSSGSGGDVSQINFLRIGSGVVSSIKTVRDGANNNGALTFYTALSGSNTERMRIDPSGNLGLGVTPSAWGSGYTAFQLTTYGSVYDLNAGYCGQASNAYNNGTNWIYRTSNFANRYEQFVGSGSAHAWFIASSGTAGNAITFTQAMTLEADGDLLVGTTTASGRFTVAGYSSSNTAQDVAVVRTSSGTTIQSGPNITFTDGTTNNTITIQNSQGALTFWNYGSGSWNERARITSGGDFLVGTTTSSGRLTVESSGLVAKFIRTTAGGNSEFKNADDAGYGISFLNASGTTAGSIYWTATTTTYATSSDERLKENIVDAPQASAIIDGIKVRSFDWKADGVHQRFGVIAQELEQVAPEAVGRPAGDDNQFLGVDYSKLVPMLIKEIQSLRARVAALESKGA